MQLLSVVIITYNEEKNISRCLNSVANVADEVIIVDSFSSDETVSIARQKGSIVFQKEFHGYKEQKNFALQLTTHNFVLSLDADEALSNQLKESILAAKNDPSPMAYTMNRCTNYCGRFIKHGLWYPDKKIRLFDKRFMYWGGMNPHDKVELKQDIRVLHLEGDLLHYAYDSFEDHIQRNDERSSIAAESLFGAGRRMHWLNLIINPTWKFFNGYLLRFGFLDGMKGFISAYYTAQETWLKYFKLYQLQKLQVRVDKQVSES